MIPWKEIVKAAAKKSWHKDDTPYDFLDKLANLIRVVDIEQADKMCTAVYKTKKGNLLISANSKPQSRFELEEYEAMCELEYLRKIKVGRDLKEHIVEDKRLKAARLDNLLQLTKVRDIIQKINTLSAEYSMGQLAIEEEEPTPNPLTKLREELILLTDSNYIRTEITRSPAAIRTIATNIIENLSNINTVINEPNIAGIISSMDTNLNNSDLRWIDEFDGVVSEATAPGRHPELLNDFEIVPETGTGKYESLVTFNPKKGAYHCELKLVFFVRANRVHYYNDDPTNANKLGIAIHCCSICYELITKYFRNDNANIKFAVTGTHGNFYSGHAMPFLNFFDRPTQKIILRELFPNLRHAALDSDDDSSNDASSSYSAADASRGQRIRVSTAASEESDSKDIETDTAGIPPPLSYNPLAAAGGVAPDITLSDTECDVPMTGEASGEAE